MSVNILINYIFFSFCRSQQQKILIILYFTFQPSFFSIYLGKDRLTQKLGFRASKAPPFVQTVGILRYAISRIYVDYMALTKSCRG